MAEARQAVILHEQQKRGIKLYDSDDGLSFTIVIPPPGVAVRSVLRYLKRTAISVVYSFWPASPILVTGVMAFVVHKVLGADPNSWFRNGRLANLLWDIDSALPWTQRFPRQFRIGYLAALAASGGMSMIMLTTRGILGSLLQYRGFLYLKPGEKSMVVKTWGLAVKLLSGRKSSAMLYSYQSSLPRQPVPSVSGTVTKYLSTVKPLVSEDEYKELQSLASDFKRKSWKWQLLLQLKSYWSTHYMSDWWEKFVYLRGRDPIMINSNYYVLDGAYFKPTSVQASRAAFLLLQMMEFKKLIEDETLSPMFLNDTVPLCMNQYARMFSTTRLAEKESDVLKHVPGSKHIVVLRKGRFYRLSLYLPKSETLLSPADIEKQLLWIINDADKSEPISPAVGANIAAMTATSRTDWAEFRESHCSDSLNLESLNSIERAILVLVLDDVAPDSWSAKGKALLHGSGSNRWFDKTITFVVFPDGQCGMNAEHSWADAPVIAHMWEHVLSGEFYAKPYDEVGYCKLSSKAVVALPEPKPLRFDFSIVAQEKIRAALTSNIQRIGDLQLHVIEFRKYGKGSVKKFRCSPDSFIQMALQLAYFRSSKGEFAQTYESSMTRLYLHGRTETIRSVSEDSCAFVRAMEEKSLDKKEIAKLLVKAAETHNTYGRDCMSGKGVDRHLFALYVATQALGGNSPFLNKALSYKWKLSTSQQPQTQTNRWRGEKSESTLCPGGGFGPVADDGYGVSYMVAGEDRFFFHVSCKVSANNTNSVKFATSIGQALEDMAALFD